MKPGSSPAWLDLADNITGLSTLSPELSGKRLELLKEIIPKLTRVAVLGNSTSPGNADTLKELELAAQALKVKLQYLDVLSVNDIETAFRAAGKERADAVLVLSGSLFTSQRRQIIDLAVKSRLPASYARPEFVQSGGLMTYGPNINDMFRRAATYVDKILKGAKPADLPVEQPIEVRAHDQSESREADRLNDTAERPGQSRQSDPMTEQSNIAHRKSKILRIPPNVLPRADRVIR